MKNSPENDPLLKNTNGIRYIDVVLYNDEYYMVKPNDSGSNSVVGVQPTTESYWVKAEGFSFIATEVLLSKNAKIDFLSSNEVIIFDKDPNTSEDVNIVAGMTGGGGNHSTTDINNDNPVVIWAGSEVDSSETEINLNDANFKVYKDGTLVSKEANISGNISANSISLKGDEMFWYNQSAITLPSFKEDQHMIAYIMLYNNGS